MRKIFAYGTPVSAQSLWTKRSCRIDGEAEDNACRLESVRRRTSTQPLPPCPRPFGPGQKKAYSGSSRRVDWNRRDVEHTHDLPHHALDRLNPANAKLVVDP
ncbi:hypothetical protein C8F04DRAFT_1193746 [Mycena alexandri]|uniref:Uncharacterized protein n=1 Tax=Mycena alexandri TaxID=1745969 RepID=A0AAD6S8Y6_9AGAR|nr:hypothetical protein C8F04DRAFT_1193746 [Mycena alexandri]